MWPKLQKCNNKIYHGDKDKNAHLNMSRFSTMFYTTKNKNRNRYKKVVGTRKKKEKGG